MEEFNSWILPLLLGALGIIFILNFSKFAKVVIKLVFGHIVRTLMTDDYGENLLELYSAGTRTGFQKIMELNLRSEFGKIPERPLGSNKKFPGFDNLMFDVAQLHTLPLEMDVPIDLKVTIGPQAKKPLILDMPILIGGMGYGISLSNKAKIALARGASLAGTAFNTGSGPFLQAERDNAKQYIYQYNRGFWGKDPAILRKADAIEIQLGQGAAAGLPRVMPANEIDQELQQAFPIPPGCDAVIKARFPEVNKPEDLKKLVQKIRQQVDGVPVGIKMAGGKNLELDLQLALDAGVDFITLGGAQAGTYGAPPSICDNYALPTLFLLVRARKFLEIKNAVGKVSLIINGGFSEPGEMLKALALGADAVGIGTAAIFAISHTQVLKALPWEPPTQIIWYKSKYADKYDENLGAQTLANYLKACKDEMADGLRVMGKVSLKHLSGKDLMAMDRTTAEVTGATLAYRPQKIRIPGFSIKSWAAANQAQPNLENPQPLPGTAPDSSVVHTGCHKRRYKYRSAR